MRVKTMPLRVLRKRSDEELAELCHAGQVAAYDLIVERYRDRLTQYCTRLVDRDTAEDVAQYALHKTYEILMTTPGRVIAIRPWLFRVAHNRALNILRDASTPTDDFEDLLDAAPDADAVYEQRAAFERVVSLVKQLPPRQRDALLMRELDGYSYDEIGNFMDEDAPVVAQLIRRARTRLRERFTLLLLPLLRLLFSGGGEPRAAVGAVGATKVAVVVAVGTVIVSGGLMMNREADGPRDHDHPPVVVAQPNPHRQPSINAAPHSTSLAVNRVTLDPTTDIAEPLSHESPALTDPPTANPLVPAVGTAPGSVQTGSPVASSATIERPGPSTNGRPISPGGDRPAQTPWEQYLNSHDQTIDLLAQGQIDKNGAAILMRSAWAKLLDTQHDNALPSRQQLAILPTKLYVMRIKLIRAQIKAAHNDPDLTPEAREAIVGALSRQQRDQARSARVVQRIDRIYFGEPRQLGRLPRVNILKWSGGRTKQPKPVKNPPHAQAPSETTGTPSSEATAKHERQAKPTHNNTVAPPAQDQSGSPPSQPKSKPAKQPKPAKPGRIEQQAPKQPSTAPGPAPQSQPAPVQKHKGPHKTKQPTVAP